MSKAECLVKKWSPHYFSTGSYPGEDYKKFQREARAALKELADAAGYVRQEHQSVLGASGTSIPG